MRNEEVRFNWLLMLLTIVFAAAAWFVSAFLRVKLGLELPRFVLIGICFAVTGLIIGAAVCITSKACGSFEANILTGRRSGGIVLVYILIGVIVLFGLGALMEYVYEMDFNKSQEATAYVFLIDDSGSMSRNDETMARYDAVNELLDSCDDDLTYVVYSFSDEIILSEVGKAADGQVEFSGDYGGQTNIRGVLETALNDYNNGVWDGGKNPKFVLLTDGYPNDVYYYQDLDTVLEGYSEKGLMISCVGMIEADENLLEYISDATGGVTVNVENVDGLGTAMTTAAKSGAARDLFSYRRGTDLNYVYAIIRVLAITILGTIIGVLSAICYGDSDYAKSIMIIGACKSLVAGLVLEFGINLLNIADLWCWLAAWVIMCTVFTQRKFVRLNINTDHGSVFS
jgi:Ca-activated chloride channel homolog